MLYVVPLCGGFEHVESKCDQVSMALVGIMVHFMFYGGLGVLKFSVCMIWACVIP